MRLIEQQASHEHVANACAYLYTKDHLGSIREVVASDGTTIEAAYDYSPWGEVSKIAGTGAESDFLYTGHFYHDTSDLHLTLYRAYNPNLGMWLSRDPIAENGGINLYAYVGNDPVNYWDPLGLQKPRVGWVKPSHRNPIAAARSKIGSRMYAPASPWPPKWAGKPKCNKFVGDVLDQSVTTETPLVNGRYPTALEWQDPSVDIPGYSAPHRNPQPGDVVASGGHVGLQTEDGVIQASSNTGTVYESKEWKPNTARTPNPKECDEQ